MSVLVITCSGPIAAAPSDAMQPKHSSGYDRALAIPAKVSVRCNSGAGKCQLAIPAAIRSRRIYLQRVKPGSRCPTSTGSFINVPGASGTALKGKVVSLLVPQAGDVLHGSVQLAQSDVSGWYGIKTHWLVDPSYSGWVIVRAEQLDGRGPVAALGEAGVEPVVIPPGPTANTFKGWRQQPSGTYVKSPGCFGFQVDGSSFTEQIILNAVLPKSPRSFKP